ncbi:M23 family metallopeptidase [Alteromonas sp. 1_MG-2023]|uniref:M23 family metallopeptidase n=1 Tax=Alteromonas sp. 1_MG-2023 TaxID=3062669 RepID=UPI0026E1DEA5|nr:M23 family metallopeptidase [Alteromonas sp. 1_MG-2023]MDO6566923.1 M23 family metallopeptidase [Alteromonas sp. 1_MG-2023]
MPLMTQFSLALFFVFVCCAPLSALLAQETMKQNQTIQAPGCFDANRFCISISPPTNGNYEVYAQRKVPLPLVLTLSANGLIPNSTSNVFLNDDTPVLMGAIKNPRRFWHSMKVSWTSGVLNAVHNDEVIYMPPLRPAAKYRVVQGFGGGYSHTGASRYALDFAAPVGTPVYAARHGVVIDTKDDGKRGGPSKQFAKHANFVAILHDDGTTGEYYHLKYNGVVVEREQQVKAGELIGYSGNTGFSSLPHLHFAVYKAKYEGMYMSVPFELKD